MKPQIASCCVFSSIKEVVKMFKGLLSITMSFELISFSVQRTKALCTIFSSSLTFPGQLWSNSVSSADVLSQGSSSTDLQCRYSRAVVKGIISFFLSTRCEVARGKTFSPVSYTHLTLPTKRIV